MRSVPSRRTGVFDRLEPKRKNGASPPESIALNLDFGELEGIGCETRNRVAVNDEGRGQGLVHCAERRAGPAVLRPELKAFVKDESIRTRRGLRIGRVATVCGGQRADAEVQIGQLGLARVQPAQRNGLVNRLADYSEVR